MKLLLFKSKTCGPCKMFEPQVIKAAEELKIEYIPVDVEENETFNIGNKNITTSELIKKYAINSSGKLLFILNEEVENGPMILFERPTHADLIVKKINSLIKNS